MANHVHLVKLSVGTESVEGLEAWQDSRRDLYPDGLHRHVTRMWPKREAEILRGGSIYWVIKGTILCRQQIERLDEVRGEDGLRRCAIVMAPDLVRVSPAPKRAFQGWRYLAAGDAPPDLARGRPSDDALPATLSVALAEIGIL